MSRSLPRFEFVASLGGLAVCALAALGLGGCGNEGGSANRGGGKFQVAPNDDAKDKPSTPERATKGQTDSDLVAIDDPPGAKSKDGDPTGKPPVVPSEKLGEYRVPDGEPEEIQAYMQQLGQRRPRGSSQEEMRADFVKIQRARIAAAEKLLAGKDLDKVIRKDAAITKISALETLAQRDEPGALEEMSKYLKALSKDSDPELARSGRLMSFDLESMILAQKVEADDADPKPILANLKKFLAAEEKDESSFRVAQRTASVLGQLGKRELVSEAFRLIGDAFVSSEEKQLAEAGQSALDQALLLEVEFDEKLEAAATDKPDSVEPLLAALDKVLSAKTLGGNAFEQIAQAASTMEFTRHFDVSKQMLERIGKAFKDHPNEEIAKAAAEAVEKGNRRLGLIGKPFVVEGELLDGSQFDWSKYKGKVVLIDFWATWCGPCIKEIPNIKRNYEKYREHGFEVVGVNCDDEKMAVERFFADRDLPWATLHSTDPEARGMKNSLAVKCGVNAIPFLVLVNAQGNVEAIHVSGEHLGEKLAAMFPGAEKPAAETGRKPIPEKPASDKAGSRMRSAPRDEAPGPTYFIALADEEAKPEEEVNPYLADDNLKPEELADFLLKMQDKPKSIQKRPGFCEAMVEAADRILAAKAQDKYQFIAVEAKCDALHKRACLGDEKCDQALAAFVDSLKDDMRDRVAREVKFFQLERSVIEGDKLPVEDLPELFAKLKEFYGKEKLADRHLRIASSTVALINRLEDGDAREKEFVEFGTLLAKSSDKQLARYGKKLTKKPGESDSKLVGQPLELVGNTAEGQPFKWEAYRGKVVLVDFWATWCGPCRREMPHVKELYEKHKDKGFDVVGVSIDKDLDALAEYLQENSIAWSTLSGEETQDLADKYGVRGIPTMMLVDKDGKIVAVSHSVGGLTSKLEKLLAPVAVEKPAQ